MLRRIKIDWANLPHFSPLEIPFPEPLREFQGLIEITAETYPDFIEKIGLVGMGGSGFPSSEKVRACIGAHTLVINGVECEPGITIDQTVLLHQSEWIKTGVEASATAIGAKRIVLAVKKNAQQISQLKTLYPSYEIVSFPDRYPAGAEKLILKKLDGKMPPPGVRPYQLGYLVQNVVSLRAIGRALIDGIPAVERPLTLTMPSTGFYKNILAPVGLLIREVLETFDLPYDPSKHIIAASGLMMGHEVTIDDCIEKTTTSLILLERKKLEDREHGCIRCGACNTACPLGLHPFILTELIQQGKTGSPAFQAQMTECFLCGACSAVCPSHIPLVQTLTEGKQCLS
jgi:electron transport complex protein RnfC